MCVCVCVSECVCVDLAYLLRDSSEETSSVYSLAGCETQSLQRQAVRRPEQNGTGVWSHVTPQTQGPKRVPFSSTAAPLTDCNPDQHLSVTGRAVRAH